MSITNKLNQIKNAIYGKEVRGAIHDAIKQVYDDASVSHDNANMEVKMARGTHNTLNDRLDNVDEIQAQTNAQLSQKLNKNSVLSMANMGQDVKEAMTGGSVSVVGRDAVLTENVVDGQITPIKTSFIIEGKNKFNKDMIELGGYYNSSNIFISNSSYFSTDFIKYIPNTDMSISQTVVNSKYTNYIINYYDNSKMCQLQEVITPEQILANGGFYVFNKNYHFIKIGLMLTHLDVIMVSESSNFEVYESYQQKLVNITSDEIIGLMNENNLLKERVNVLENKDYGIDFSKFNLAYIKNNQLTCNPTGKRRTAKYTGIDLGSTITPLLVKAQTIWSKGVKGGAVAIISNPNGLKSVSGITTKSLHPVFLTDRVEIGLYENNSNTVIKTIDYSEPIKMDGQTVYDIGFSYYAKGNELTIYLPDGTTEKFTHEKNIADYIGQYITWEHYWDGTVDSQPIFTQFYCRDSNNFIFTDDFKRQDGSIGVNPYGYSYIQLTNYDA